MFIGVCQTFPGTHDKPLRNFYVGGYQKLGYHFRALAMVKWRCTGMI